MRRIRFCSLVFSSYVGDSGKKSCFPRREHPFGRTRNVYGDVLLKRRRFVETAWLVVGSQLKDGNNKNRIKIIWEIIYCWGHSENSRRIAVSRARLLVVCVCHTIGRKRRMCHYASISKFTIQWSMLVGLTLGRPRSPLTEWANKVKDP